MLACLAVATSPKSMILANLYTQLPWKRQYLPFSLRMHSEISRVIKSSLVDYAVYGESLFSFKLGAMMRM